MSTTGTTRSPGDPVAEVLQRHPGLVVLGRVGWLAKGLVYAVLGVLALSIATADRGGPAVEGQEASQSGAVARIAESPAGDVALWAVAVGLALYVLWRVVSIVLPSDGSAKAWAVRAGYAASAVAYGSLAWSAASFAGQRGAGQGGGQASSENARVERVTAELMGHTGGRWLVGAVGILAVAVAAYFARTAVRGDLSDEIEARDVGPLRHSRVVVLGRVGWAGRAGMVALVGVFLVRAAVQARPDEAEGLDGALRRLVDTAWGPWVVAAVGVGLLVYGAYCIVSTPVRRLKGAG